MKTYMLNHTGIYHASLLVCCRCFIQSSPMGTYIEDFGNKMTRSTQIICINHGYGDEIEKYV